MLWWQIVAFVLAGIVSGYLAGLFGIGGGILRVPLFVYLFKQFGVGDEVLMHMAEGTSLALVIPSAIAASWKQHRLGRLDLDYLRTWAVALFFGVLLGVFLLPHLTTRFLQGLFIGFLVLVAVYVGLVPETFVFSKELPKRWLKWLLAFVIGTCSVLIGIGGGAFTTPTLKAFSYPLKRAIALATAGTFVVGAVGTVGAIVFGWGVADRTDYSLGYVDLIAFVVMLPVVWIFAPLGAKTAHHMRHEILRRAYAGFLILMAAYMAYELFAI